LQDRIPGTANKGGVIVRRQANTDQRRLVGGMRTPGVRFKDS
jgi:hypothetical protein